MPTDELKTMGALIERRPNPTAARLSNPFCSFLKRLALL